MTDHPLDKLLAAFDPDRERAGDVYERLRQKLLKFFEWRGTACSEELTDRTIDRVARKIDEGETIRDPDPSGYFYAVARNILLEHWNEHGREKTILRTLVPRDETSAQKLEQERRLRCLERCLLQLLPETRQLILRYYNGERRAKIQNRKEIAGELRVPISALRIRMHRLRSRLESCVEKCLTRSLGGETDLVSGHKKGGDERS